MLLEKSENLRLRCQDLWYKVKNRPSIRKVQTKSSWKKTAGSVRTHDGRGSVWSRPWRNTFWARANERRGWEHIVKTWPVELCTVQGCLGDQCAWRCWSEDHLCSGTWWGEVSAAPWLWNTLHLLNSACSVSGIPSEWNFFLIFLNHTWGLFHTLRSLILLGLVKFAIISVCWLPSQLDYSLFMAKDAVFYSNLT